MKLKKILDKTLVLIVFTTIIVLFELNSVHANTIFPHTKEFLLLNRERSEEVVSFRNDSRKEILITPIVYSYDPITLEMSENDGYIFLRTEKEIFSVQPNEILELNYEVIPVSSMRPGTYFNLIVLQKQQEDVFITETNPIGTVDSLAHLAVLHIVDSESDIKGISTEFADIEIQIVDKGVPFLAPTRIKYTYQNKTNYVLNPMGEIQLYSTKGKYPPEYIKINKEQKKLYPDDIIEEEFEIERYHFSDFFTQKMILGRFYNGLDDNLILKETIIQPNYYTFVGIGIIILSTISLLKVLFSKTRKAEGGRRKDRDSSSKKNLE
jgi:hypothetical protein